MPFRSMRCAEMTVGRNQMRSSGSFADDLGKMAAGILVTSWTRKSRDCRFGLAPPVLESRTSEADLLQM
jgi:hypothetical protein